MASLVVFLMALVSAAMISAVLLHTRIAERQLEIDGLDRGVRQTQEEYDRLRAERATYRSPSNLAAEAEAMGMVPGEENDFLVADPAVVAQVIASTGVIPSADKLVTGATGSQDPLDQFRLVKRVAAEAP